MFKEMAASEAVKWPQGHHREDPEQLPKSMQTQDFSPSFLFLIRKSLLLHRTQECKRASKEL